jgi:hypothetical protein
MFTDALVRGGPADGRGERRVGLASIGTPVSEDLRVLSARTDALRAVIERAVETFGPDTETAAAVRAASEAVPETRAEFFAAVLALISEQSPGGGQTARLRLLT